MSDQLQTVLKELMASIAGEGGGNVAHLLGELDRIRLEEADSLPPMLQHYLERRSYAKALDFFEGRDESDEPSC